MQNVEIAAIFTRAVRELGLALKRAALQIRIGLYQMCADAHAGRLRLAYWSRRHAAPGALGDAIDESKAWIEWAHKNQAIARSKLAGIR